MVREGEGGRERGEKSGVGERTGKEEGTSEKREKGREIAEEEEAAREFWRIFAGIEMTAISSSIYRSVPTEVAKKDNATMMTAMTTTTTMATTNSSLTADFAGDWAFINLFLGYTNSGAGGGGPKEEEKGEIWLREPLQQLLPGNQL